MRAALFQTARTQGSACFGRGYTEDPPPYRDTLTPPPRAGIHGSPIGDTPRPFDRPQLEAVAGGGRPRRGCPRRAATAAATARRRSRRTATRRRCSTSRSHSRCRRGAASVWPAPRRLSAALGEWARLSLASGDEGGRAQRLSALGRHLGPAPLGAVCGRRRGGSRSVGERLAPLGRCGFGAAPLGSRTASSLFIGAWGQRMMDAHQNADEKNFSKKR